VEDDLAALQVTAAGLPCLPLGDSDVVEPGRPVKVLGFPFGRRVEVGRRAGPGVVPEVTVTAGSLSAARASEEGTPRFLQTDASVHPGSSGGPMLDEDGYVVGVVGMKLARDAASQGAGFAVPVNLVKDFLEASGLGGQLPVTRLRPGFVHTIDWKHLRVELPDGFGDTSPSRLLLDGGQVGEIGFRAERVASPLPVEAIQAALMEGDALPGFVPGPATVARQVDVGGRQGPRERLGTAFGTTVEGERFRVEFAIVDQRGEKVVARYLGPADALAFNLGLVRRSLRSLEADPMLFGPGTTPLVGNPRNTAFESVVFPQGEGGRVLAPPRWVVEPAARASCGAMPPAPVGLAASHPGDYTLVLRALRWPGSGPALAEALIACGGRATGSGLAAYGLRFSRLGVPVAARGALVQRDGGSLLLELEAPVAKLPIVEGLYERWVRQVTLAIRRSGEGAVAAGLSRRFAGEYP
jgi:hypothetical protein